MVAGSWHFPVGDPYGRTRNYQSQGREILQSYRHIKTGEVVYLREPRTVSSYGLTVLVDATNEPFNRSSVVPV